MDREVVDSLRKRQQIDELTVELQRKEQRTVASEVLVFQFPLARSFMMRTMRARVF